MAKPSKLAHVVYMTRRYEEMLSWYQTVFEARVQYENPAFAFLTYDDEHYRFAFANMDVLSPNGAAAEMPAGVGVNHVGYTFANAGELLGVANVNGALVGGASLKSEDFLGIAAAYR